MLKAFALLAMFNGQTYVLDSGLYEDDCAAARDTAPGLIMLEPGYYVERPAVILICRDYLPGQAPGTINN